jgi:hypothetical protein
LHAPISKNFATYGVTTEEEEMFRTQQLDLIYAQSGMLYHLLPDAPRLNYDPRQKLGPHANGIVGTANVNFVDSVKIHMKELSLNQFVGGPTSFVSSNPYHSTDVHSVKSSANLNGNQKPGGNKKKGHNNPKGGKNDNKPKENGNNDNMNDNVGEGK